MLEESTTSKTTLWISLVLTWFDDGPHSNKGLGKTIGSTTNHEDQSMKRSYFFNRHSTRHPFQWTKSDKLLSSNSPSCCLSQPTSSWISNIDSWRMGGLEKNQHDHKLNIAARWQTGNTSNRIFGTSRTTDMLLSSRTTLLFRARRYDQMSEDLTKS